MRVLMVNRSDAHTVMGGDTVQMVRTAAELRALGVEVEEWAGSPTEAQIQAADWVHLFNLQTPVFTLEQAQRAKAAGKPAAVSTIFWDFGAEQLIGRSFKWGLLARILGRSLALRLAQRRVESAARADRDRVREILRLADVLLPNSNAEVGHLRRLLPKLGRVAIIPNAVDPDRHRPDRVLPRPSDLPAGDYLLVAARIEPDKNQLEFCRAVCPSGRTVALAGSAPNPEYLAACRAEGAYYLGQLKDEALDGAMAHARVHALPSYRETPGLASLEAAALGCAIVTTSIGSAREYFGDDAHYVDPTARRSMARGVDRAWAEGPKPGLSERIRTQYCWRRAAERTLAAYQGFTRSASSGS